jgi:membrane-associated phospholipid phosphatase
MTALAPREQTSATSPPERGPGHLFLPFAVAVLAAAGVFVVYRIFMRTSLGQLVDTAALRGGDVHHPKVDEVLGRTLNGTTLVSVVLVCLVAAAIGMLRKRIDLAVGAAFLVLGANGSTQLLKDHLVRPDLDRFPAPNSFPSGHTAAAASVAFALILVLPHAVRGTVALIGFAYVTVIAVATVWAEWHRPSDTIAAMLVVLAWGALAVLGIRIRRRRRPGPAERPIRLALLPLLAVGAVTAVAGLLGMLAVALSERVTPGLVSGRFAFLAGSAAMAAAAAGAFVFWVRLTSGPRPARGAAPVEAEDTGPAPRAVRRPKGGPK